MLRCKSCGLSKPLDKFYSHPKASNGKDSSCKPCRREKVTANRRSKPDYYQSYDRNRPNHAERIAKQGEVVKLKRETDDAFRLKVNSVNVSWSNRNPEKRKAQYTLSSAVRDGKLVRPDECEHCLKSGVRIQGHHWSYLPEHRLDVVWLCTGCHGAEHRRLNELGRDPDKV